VRASERVRARYGEGWAGLVVFDEVSVGDWSCADMSGRASEMGFGARVVAERVEEAFWVRL